MIRLQESNNIKEIRHNHRDHGHDDGDLVLPVPRGLGLALRRPLHDDDDGVRGTDQTKEEQKIGKDSLGDRFPALLLQFLLLQFFHESFAKSHDDRGDLINFLLKILRKYSWIFSNLVMCRFYIRDSVVPSCEYFPCECALVSFLGQLALFWIVGHFLQNYCETERETTFEIPSFPCLKESSWVNCK